MSESAEAADWKRRERALTGAILTMVFALTAILTVAPQEAVAFLQSRSPFAVGGMLLFSTGVMGAVFDLGMQLVFDRVGDGSGGLTDWEGGR